MNTPCDTATPSPPERALHLRRVLAECGRAAPGPGLESAGPAEATVPPPDEVLGRVDAVLRAMPRDEVPDPAAFEQALKTLFLYGEGALRKLALPESDTPAFGLSGDQMASLEAIVITDGSRPSFLLRQGAVAAEHPFLADWRDPMADFASRLQTLAGAVGRIQPGGGHASRFAGTGTLVDRDKGLVLTNFHVVDDARSVFGVEMENDGAGGLRVLGELFIDFDGEVGTAGENLFKVVAVQLPPGAGRGFGALDAAVLRIESAGPNSRLPDAQALLSADMHFANGGSEMLATIGFPGTPTQSSPLGTTVDWNFVVKTLFGNRFGVKRVAPGKFMAPPGSVTLDASKRVLTHDATTFGGSSGSLIFALGEEAAPAFGLHFAGVTLSANHAVALARAADALRSVGLALQD